MPENTNAVPENQETPEIQEEYIKENTWKDTTFFVVMKQFVRNKTAIVGFVVAFLLIMLSLLAPVLAPYDYAKIDPRIANQPPSDQHWFGTDNYGRDVLSRILWGGRYSLAIGFGAEAISIIMGVILGAIAGYYSGWVETIILRFCDIMQNIPGTLLNICIAQALGGGFGATLIALSVGTIPGGVRVLRAMMLTVREQEYIEAAHAINASNTRIMFKHIVPNCLAPIIINASMGIGGKIMQSAGLSFIGLGIQEPIPEWGAMISAGREYMRYCPHLIFIPGIFVALVVLAFNLIGDGLRDALDPKLRQ